MLSLQQCPFSKTFRYVPRYHGIREEGRKKRRTEGKDERKEEKKKKKEEGEGARVRKVRKEK